MIGLRDLLTRPADDMRAWLPYIPGERADEQLTRWEACGARSDTATAWVYINVGINDILQSASTATIEHLERVRFE